MQSGSEGSLGPGNQCSDSLHWFLQRLYLGGEDEIVKNVMQSVKESPKESESCYQLTESSIEFFEEMNVKLARKRGDFSSAAAEFNRSSVERSFFSWISLKQNARCLFLQGKFSASLDLYLKLLKKAGDEWEIIHCIGCCYQELGNLKEALNWFQKALLIQQHPKTIQKLLQVNESIGELTKKENREDSGDANFSSFQAYLNLMLEFMPTNVQAINQIAFKLMDQGDISNALDLFISSLGMEQKPNENRDAKLGLAAIFHLLHRADFSLLKYEELVSDSLFCANRPAWDCEPWFWNNLGANFYSLMKLIPASNCLKLGLLLDPLSYVIHYNLGLVYYKGRQFFLAFHHFECSERLAGDSKEPALSPPFSMIYARLGQILSLASIEPKEESSHSRELSEKIQELLKPLHDPERFEILPCDVYRWLAMFYNHFPDLGDYGEMCLTAYEKCKNDLSDCKEHLQLNEFITFGKPFE